MCLTYRSFVDEEQEIVVAAPHALTGPMKEQRNERRMALGLGQCRRRRPVLQLPLECVQHITDCHFKVERKQLSPFRLFFKNLVALFRLILICRASRS